MKELLPFIPYFIGSYALIFIGGYVWAREKYKTKARELQKAQRRLVTYNREGRVGQ